MVKHVENLCFRVLLSLLSKPLFNRNDLSVQQKVKDSTTYFAPSLNHDKLFAFAGKHPLHFAAKSRSTEIVELLLDHGADVEKEDHRGKTFLVPLLLLLVPLS